MAEAIFRHKVLEANLDSKLEIDSCGTAAYHLGEKPEQNHEPKMDKTLSKTAWTTGRLYGVY